jgi:hypothetical protein
MTTRTVRRRSPSRSSAPRQEFDGVYLPGRPERPVPEIPLDLTDLHDKRIMELFALYVAWNCFFDVQRVHAEIEEADAETGLKVLQATSLADGWQGPKETRITILRAERDTDPEVMAAQARYDQAKARRKMTGVLCGNMERGAALLSRELTRRVGRAPVEGRAAGGST